MKKITLLMLMIGFSSFMSAQCLTAISATPQYPIAAYTPATCDGLTVNSVTTVGYTSEYSVINVTAGETYTFTSSVATDFITISSDGGANADIFGVTPITWVSTVTGPVRFYTHLDDTCAGAGTSTDGSRTRGVVCGTPPTCIAPTAIVISNVATGSFTVSWTASTTIASGGYDYYYSMDNTAPDASTSPSGSVAAGITTTDISGLDSATTYYVWIRSNCGGGDLSTWKSAGSIATLCNSVTDFSEGFDNVTTPALPVCWAKVGAGGGANTQASIGSPSSPNAMYIYGSSATSKGVVSMVPVSNAGDGTHWLKFRTRANFTVGGNLEVGYLTNPSDVTSFVSVSTVTATSLTVWDDYNVDLGTAPGTNQVLAFRHTGVPANSILVDDVVWEVKPTCINPTGLAVSTVGSTTATISWTASTTVPSQGYQYYFSIDSMAPDASTSPSGSVAAGITTANLTLLDSATTYYVWVRSNCGGGDLSSWTPVAVSFTTACEAVTDFSESFDNVTTPAFPVCWAKVGTGGAASTQATTGSPSSPNVMYIYGSSATSQGIVSMVPVSNAGDGTHWLKFRTRANFTVGGNLEVGYLTNPSDATSFVSLSTVTATSLTVWDSYNVDLGTAPGTNQTLAFRHTGAPANSILVDDVIWEAKPTCVNPTGLVVSPVGSTTATISWTASTTAPSQGYQYYFSIDSMAPDASTSPSGSVATGVTTANLILLQSSTIYYVWVRSNCGSGDLSSWTSVATFTTACDAISTLPWTENFDSMTTLGAGIVPSCWSAIAGTKAWTSGNAASTTYNMPNSAPNYMRIGYSNTNASDLWTPAFALTANHTYQLSFSYNTNGTTSSFVGFTGNVFVNTTSGSIANAINIGTFINPTDGTAAYTPYMISFTPQTTGTYYFDLNVSSNSSPWYLGVDDFMLEDLTLGTNTFNNSNFVCYPNPVKDILNLSYNKNITNVAVFNLLGQQVMTKSVNANQSQVDMSNLSIGTYLVKVTADNQVKTIKVIKN